MAVESLHRDADELAEQVREKRLPRAYGPRYRG